jgi:GxxExxY protein
MQDISRRGAMEARMLMGHSKHSMNVLGTGHKESVYHKALVTSLNRVGVLHRSEVVTPIMFMGECVGIGRADLVLGDCVVEIKANSKCPQRASGQLRKYMESMGAIERHQNVVGIIINFNQATGEVEMAQDSMEDPPRKREPSKKRARTEEPPTGKKSRFF